MAPIETPAPSEKQLECPFPGLRDSLVRVRLAGGFASRAGANPA